MFIPTKSLLRLASLDTGITVREPDKRDGNHAEETNRSLEDLYQNEGGVEEVLPSTWPAV